jgi:hypothetical protein
MTQLKYSKLRLNELPPAQRNRGFGRWPQTILFTDTDVIEGSNHFWAFWVTSLPRPAHGPHTHDDDELLVFLGSDPKNMRDLGCEVELSMGPEMEKHVFTESTLVYIPKHLVHGPIRFRNLRKPFIFIQAVCAPKLTEKPFRDLVPEKERDTMIFFNFDGAQADDEIQKAYQSIQELTQKLKQSPPEAPFKTKPTGAGDADKTKYGEYFWHELNPEKRKYKWGRMPTTVLCVDDSLIQGCHQFWALWVNSLPWPFHGPHTHKHPESMIIIGTDPQDPQDAGLETEDHMGIEMEKYITKKTNLIFMPAGFVHGPIRYKNLTRPFIMVQCHYAPKLTEKSYKKLAPEEDKGKLVFFDLDGTETQEELDKKKQNL